MVVAVVIAGLALPMLPASAVDTPTPEPTATTSVPSVEPVPYLVTFAAGVTADQQATILTDAGATEVGTIPQLRMHTVTLPADSAPAVADALRAQTSVSNVNLDRTRTAEGAPDDTRYDDQWSLPKIGWDNVRGIGEPCRHRRRRPPRHRRRRQSSRTWPAPSSPAPRSSLDGSTGTDDPNGHGTAMAGIVAAETDNGSGIAGIGYAGVKVMPVTVLGARGPGPGQRHHRGIV